MIQLRFGFSKSCAIRNGWMLFIRLCLHFCESLVIQLRFGFCNSMVGEIAMHPSKEGVKI